MWSLVFYQRMHVGRRWVVEVFVGVRHYLPIFFVPSVIILNCFMWFNFCRTIGMIHSGASISRLPVGTTWFSWSFTTTLFLRKVTSIPPSHTNGVEDKDLIISLKTVSFFICRGSAGIPNFTLAIDCMSVFLAHWTSIGCCSIVFPGKFGGKNVLLLMCRGMLFYVSSLLVMPIFCSILIVIVTTRGRINNCFV